LTEINRAIATPYMPVSGRKYETRQAQTRQKPTMGWTNARS
jgi:hypothetical protein